MMRFLFAFVVVAEACCAADLAQIRALIDAGNRAEARSIAQQWLDSAPAGIERTHALNALAQTWVTGLPSDTTRVRQLTSEAGDTEGLVILANQLSQAGDNPHARETLEQAIARGGSDYRTKLLLARFTMLAGDREASKTLYEKTLSDLTAPQEIVEALDGLGNLFNTMSQYAEAKVPLERAVAIGESSPGKGLAEVLSSLAITAYGLGDYPKTLDLAQRSIGLFEADPSHSLVSLGVSYRILGQAREGLGDYEGARADLRRSVQADGKLFGEDSMQVADDLNVLAIAEANSGDLEASRKQFAGVLAIYESRLGPDNTRTGGALANLSQVLIRLHRLPEAQQNLERALAIQTKAAGPESNDVAQLYQKIAQVAAGRGRYEEARELLERNLAIWRVQLGPAHPFLVNSLTLLAGALAHTANHAAAVKTSLQAARLRREYVTDTMRTVGEREALQIAGRNPTTLDAALTFAGENDTASRAVWDEVIRSRALVLDEMAARYRGERTSNDPAISALIQMAAAARSDLARAALGGKNAALSEKRAAAQRTESALAAEGTLQADRLLRARAGLKETAAALPANSSLVSYVRFQQADSAVPDKNPPYAYAALILRAGAVHVVRLGDASRIEREAGATAQEIARERESAGHSERRNEAAYRTSAEALRRSVWEPVARWTAGSKQVYIVPDGVLQVVNFSALPVGADSYLVDSGPVLHILSAERDLVATSAARHAGTGLLTLGNPRFPQSSVNSCIPAFAPLPGSGREATEVAAIWRRSAGPAVTLTDRQATEKGLAEAVPGRKAVHIATHGFFTGSRCAKTDNPLMRSGLALSDGVFTAAQAASLNLQDAEWVVLSGCDTGLGDIEASEGVLGLRRAFQEAGAQTVVASLWPVDDEATRGWMASLYRYRFANNYTPARALQAANLDLLKSRRAAGLSTHPFYWAGFIAVERE